MIDASAKWTPSCATNLIRTRSLVNAGHLAATACVAVQTIACMLDSAADPDDSARHVQCSTLRAQDRLMHEHRALA